MRSMTVRGLGAPQPPAQPPAQPPGRATSWPVLQQGASGDAVQSLQLLLRQDGRDLEVDGDFGPQTDATVRAYQQAHRLGVDGIVGSQTWQALLAGR